MSLEHGLPTNHPKSETDLFFDLATQTAVQHPLDRLGADVVVPHYCGQRQRHGGLVDQNHRVRESRRRQNQTGMWRRADLSAHGGAPGDPM